MRNRNWFCIGTMAAALCTATALAGSSNCCEAWGGLGCDDAGCQGTVCGVDGFCCSVAWDGICASEAASLCSDLCNGGGRGGCVGDFDGNNVVDAADLAILLGGWGNAAGDLDGNGTTDGSDLAVLLGAWGDCPSAGVCGTGGDCCSASGGLGCSDVTCCENVCAADAFCCTVAWDGICASEAASICADLCGGGGTCGTGGDCCTASGGLGCNDVTCCENVCAADGFCCSVAWDSICASEAASICADLCGGGGSSNCCTAWGGLGCDDAGCQDAVCAVDGFCCSTAWDGICASEAASLCADLCGGGGSVCGTGGDCCTASGGLGCNDVACCEGVCAADGFCCSVAWDGICASEAASICADLCGGGGSSNCCTAWGGLGCDDAGCQDAVCAVDGFCCSTAWDGICASEAASLCADLCGGGGSVCGTGGDCCTASGGLGCNDVTCCENVCAADGFCCSTAWDGICASEAASICADLCGGGGSVCGTGGDCCSASGGLGCNDVTCCENVCAADGFCCSVAWDGICASEAASICADLCGGGGASNCCTAWGGLGCDDAGCQGAVCGVDGFCCSVAWDSICAGEAASLCGDLCGGGGAPSNCCSAWGGLGCDNAGCQGAVCGVDGFCCSVAWDSICAGEAASLCSDICG